MGRWVRIEREIGINFFFRFFEFLTWVAVSYISVNEACLLGKAGAKKKLAQNDLFTVRNNNVLVSTILPRGNTILDRDQFLSFENSKHSPVD